MVAELTLQCVPAHRLVERTWAATAGEVRRRHAAWLRDNRHLRYMWLPGTDTVVVVACNPLPEVRAGGSWGWVGGIQWMVDAGGGGGFLCVQVAATFEPVLNALAVLTVMPAGPGSRGGGVGGAAEV